MNTTGIWVSWDKERYGPFKLDEIHLRIQEGTVPTRAIFHEASSNQWRPIADLPHLPPPHTPEIPEPKLQEVPWMPQGRLGRLQWFFRQAPLTIFLLITEFFLLIAIKNSAFFLSLFLTTLFAGALIIGIFNDIKRWRDIGLSPWFELTMIIPLAPPIVALYLLWKPTEDDDPPTISQKQEGIYIGSFLTAILLVYVISRTLLGTLFPAMPTRGSCRTVSQQLEGTYGEPAKPSQPAPIALTPTTTNQPQPPTFTLEKSAVQQEELAIQEITRQASILCQEFETTEGQLTPQRAKFYAPKYDGFAKTAKFHLASLITAENDLNAAMFKADPKRNTTAHQKVSDLHKLQARYCEYLSEMARMLTDPALPEARRAAETLRLNQELMAMEERLKTAKASSKK